MSLKYPYSRPNVTEADIDAVVAVLRGQFLTQGPQIEAFENELAHSLGAAHAVACSNGTAALHLAYMAARLGAERGLLTSPITFLATANAGVMCGAPVSFADVDPITGNLLPAAAREALAETNSPIGAIVPVHLGGRPCDMEAFRSLADEIGCLLIEDACHAPGAVYRDASGASHVVGACTHSDMAVFSFHAIKHIATGEGGAVLCNDGALAAAMRQLRNHGLSRDPGDWQDPPEPDAPWYYEMAEIGWNYRLTDIQCALGRGQLARLAESLAARRRVAARYHELLDGAPHLSLPPRPDHEDGHAWHLYPLAVDFPALGKSRGDVIRELMARGVGTQVHYTPLYRQPYYRVQGHAPLSGAEQYYAQTLSIPMYPEISDADVAEIADAIREVIAP